jgi:hypothetical protein
MHKGLAGQANPRTPCFRSSRPARFTLKYAKAEAHDCAGDFPFPPRFTFLQRAEGDHASYYESFSYRGNVT